MSDTEPTETVFSDAPSSTNGADGDTLYDTSETTPSEGPREKAPVRHEPRVSTEKMVGMLWGSAGMMLERSGADMPVGRVLQFQAPLAGKKIDELIRDTWIDHVLQPFVRRAEKVEGLGTIILFPVLVGAVERNPELMPVVSNILREVIEATLDEMAPVIRAKKTRTARTARAMKDVSDLFEDMDLPKGADPIEAIIATIFAVPEPMAEPMAEAE